jgi:hypothetical protein
MSGGVPIGAQYSPRLICTAGDRLIHPADRPNDLARVVVRWAKAWMPETWPARQYFAALGIGDHKNPCYADQDVDGWLLLQPRPGSLAEQVRSGKVDVATALAAEAEVWPEREPVGDVPRPSVRPAAPRRPIRPGSGATGFESPAAEVTACLPGTALR